MRTHLQTTLPTVHPRHSEEIGKSLHVVAPTKRFLDFLGMTGDEWFVDTP